MINALGAVMVPSITNVFYSHAGAPRPGDVDVAALSALSRSLSPSRSAEIEALLPGGVAHVALPVFSSAAPARVYSALQRFGDVAALILDLRRCPGGELTSAIELAGDFLDQGTVIVTATDGDGDEIVYRARGERPHRFPLFLLVDHLTASAAEVFAGALQAHGRAVVVGERTYGKGSAQQLSPGFTEPGAHYATVATFTLPNGEPIEGRGIRPDVPVASEHALDAAIALSSPHEVRRCRNETTSP
jgi:carboxyl-terminal processing protease